MYSYYQTIYKQLSERVNKENQSGKRVLSRWPQWLAVHMYIPDVPDKLVVLQRIGHNIWGTYSTIQDPSRYSANSRTIAGQERVLITVKSISIV